MKTVFHKILIYGNTNSVLIKEYINTIHRYYVNYSAATIILYKIQRKCMQDNKFIGIISELKATAK
jgi:hypothetical protein